MDIIKRIAELRIVPVVALDNAKDAIPLANAGFSNLVGVLYPIFGFIGFTVMIFVLCKG
jgi:uncharacterized membrane protein YkvI